MIRRMGPGDWVEVRRILTAGIETGNATFDTAAPVEVEWDLTHIREPRLVAVDADDIAVGWVAATPVSRRPAYKGVAEVSVYVAPRHRGAGVGRCLLDAFLAEADRLGFWTVQAQIFPENDASLALHRSCGFRVVGTRERIGQLSGVWRDVILLERRSPIVR